ncbi:MAG: CDP-diacylglycerol--glycerol-3-phosphate 3-phosphatidyltransferase [Eubacteriales bacterium]
MNVPNKLTLLRVILVFILVIVYYIDTPYSGLFSAIVFVIASLTDLFDGYLARKQGIVTKFGKLLDPIADKLLVGTAVILLCGDSMIHPIIVAILIGREFIIGGYRLLAASEGVIIAADVWGKVKTIVQIVAVSFLLVSMSFTSISLFKWVGDALIYVSVLLSIISCINYIVKNRSIMI